VKKKPVRLGKRFERRCSHEQAEETCIPEMEVWSAVEQIVRDIKDGGGLAVFLRRTFPMNVEADPRRPWELWNERARNCGFVKPIVDATYEPEQRPRPARWVIRFNHPGRHGAIEMRRGQDFPLRIDAAKEN
jgi:hypothetical protein